MNEKSSPFIVPELIFLLILRPQEREWEKRQGADQARPGWPIVEADLCGSGHLEFLSSSPACQKALSPSHSNASAGLNCFRDQFAT